MATKSKDTLGSREARPAVSGGFQPTELLSSAFTLSTNKAQVLGEQIPRILKGCVDFRHRDVVCGLAVVSVLALTAQQHEVGGVLYQVRLPIECKDAPSARVVYLAARTASVGPLVLPVAVHDAYAIPPPLLQRCVCVLLYTIMYYTYY